MICDTFWGSHGCDLEPHEEDVPHKCILDYETNEACCEAWLSQDQVMIHFPGQEPFYYGLDFFSLKELT